VGEVKSLQDLEVGSEAETEVPVEEQPERKLHFHEFGGYFWGTGRRKKSIARVRVKAGEGRFIVNGRDLKEYFPILRYQELVTGPLQTTNLVGKLDVYANVRGGGITGQTGAVMMGLARALTGFDSGTELALRDTGFLTRDSRMVERKKYGRAGARRAFQFSKR
jgi:small subunit ribosomal protein S9